MLNRGSERLTFEAFAAPVLPAVSLVAVFLLALAQCLAYFFSFRKTVPSLHDS